MNRMAAPQTLEQHPSVLPDAPKRRRQGRWSRYTPILDYHRVGEAKGDHVPTVSTDAFARQLASLARWRYRVIGLDALVAQLIAGEPMPRRCAVITFDDGYEETFRIAWPLLRSFGFSATVFVIPLEVGLPGFATWGQLTQMADEGMLIGSHTMSHRYLPAALDEQLPGELIDSKRVIEAQLGRSVDFLGYPIGAFTHEAQRVAQRAGYLAACTTNRGYRRGLDLFALRRIKITERDRLSLFFRAQLPGFYDAFRRVKPPG